MKRERVNSKAVAAIGHDPETGTLEVEYHPNRLGVAAIWQYPGVSGESYKAIPEGPSIGTALHFVRLANPGMRVGSIDASGNEIRIDGGVA